jgi:hypothetical protein
MGLSSAGGIGQDNHGAVAHLAGGSTLTGLAGRVWKGHTNIAGASVFSASSEETEGVRASLVGVGIFFVDPTKVILTQFLKPTSVPKQFVAPTVAVVRPQAPGGMPTRFQINLKRKPPSSQTGGVPNEG